MMSDVEVRLCDLEPDWQRMTGKAGREASSDKSGISRSLAPAVIIVSPAAVTSESLVSREFSRIFFEISPLDLGLQVFQFHFHFSKSETKNLFTFHISKRLKGIFVSLFISRKSERISDFTLFPEKKSEIVHVTLDFVMKKSKTLVM